MFNLRDLSRVYEGLLMSTPDKYKSGHEFIRLWRNEILRVFHDRLICREDKEIVQSKIREIVNEKFGNAEHILADPILFGDYRNALHEGEARLYEDVGTYDSIKPIFEEILEEYNQKRKNMNLVFFEDALEHLTRIHRAIRMPQGNALLVGVGGSGKQSLSKLAAYTAGCSVFEITLTRGYDEASFREDLKKLYTMLGVENKRVLFLFTDAHVAEESFLELLNNMLTAGMVPALYEDADKDAMINSVRDEVTKLGLHDTKEVCWAYFVEKCRNNLHIVLAMSPVGETLRTRCRNFPGMVNNAIIDWFEPWPTQALQSVATAFLESEDLPLEMRLEIVEHMVLVHESVRDFSAKFLEELRRYNYVTPSTFENNQSYMNFLKQPSSSKFLISKINRLF